MYTICLPIKGQGQVSNQHSTLWLQFKKTEAEYLNIYILIWMIICHYIISYMCRVKNIFQNEKYFQVTFYRQWKIDLPLLCGF